MFDKHLRLDMLQMIVTHNVILNFNAFKTMGLTIFIVECVIVCFVLQICSLVLEWILPPIHYHQTWHFTIKAILMCQFHKARNTEFFIMFAYIVSFFLINYEITYMMMMQAAVFVLKSLLPGTLLGTKPSNMTMI